MDLVGLLLVAATSVSSPIQETTGFPGSEVWREAWRDLADLSRTAPNSAERRRIAAELAAFQARHERGARKRHDRPEAFRSRVLGAHLAKLDDTPFRPVPEPGVPIAWLPGEAWLAARVCEPGVTRVAAIESALAEAGPAELGERVEFAFDLAAGEARDLHWDDAREIARALESCVARAPAEHIPDAHRSGAKSAGLLAFVARMRGDHGEARTILERRLASTTAPEERAGLLVESSLVDLADGREASARGSLGEALALGSPDAGLLLARSALSEGAVPRSRALFRSLVSDPEGGTPPTPALRGYGLSLLADAGEAPATPRNLPDPPR